MKRKSRSGYRAAVQGNENFPLPDSGISRTTLNRVSRNERKKNMKKLMIAASAAFMATVGFGLESANVVG